MKKSKDVYEYNYIHQWNLRNWVKTGICEHCKQYKITEWSSKSHNYIRQDKSDWQELCPKCHSKYDREVLGVKQGRPKKDFCIYGHSMATAYVYKKYRVCSDCAKARAKKRYKKV